jgi:hypothetical protein
LRRCGCVFDTNIFSPAKPISASSFFQNLIVQSSNILYIIHLFFYFSKCSWSAKASALGVSDFAFEKNILYKRVLQRADIAKFLFEKSAND